MPVRRSRGRLGWVAPASLQVSLGEPAVAPREVEERLAAPVFAGHDLAEEDLVVAAGEDVVDPAIEEREAAGQDRRAGRCGGAVEVREVLGPRGGEPPRDF